MSDENAQARCKRWLDGLPLLLHCNTVFTHHAWVLSVDSSLLTRQINKRPIHIRDGAIRSGKPNDSGK